MNFKWNSVYMIGIGGVSMSSLARLLKKSGVNIRGYDDHENETIQKLRLIGIPVANEYEEIPTSLVVFTGAINESHPMLKQAQEKWMETIERGAFLGIIASHYKNVLSISGCHGKTTTTSMLAHVFKCARKAFSAHIGGEDGQIGNGYFKGDKYFITEACEYRRSFLSLRSSCAVILNTDYDHSDCYRNQEELLEAYRSFADNSEYVIVNSKDRDFLRHDLSFGIECGDVQAVDIENKNGKYSFTVLDHGRKTVRLTLNQVGRHQIYNALATYCTARYFRLPYETIQRGIANFHAVKRRFERIGKLNGATVICDYAHHPREIEASIISAREMLNEGGTFRVVFQPHTYSRTRDLKNEFVEALKELDSPIIYETYPAREKYEYEGSAVSLCARLPEAIYASGKENLKRRLKDLVSANDIVLVLGAGDVYDVAKNIVNDRAYIKNK